DKILDHIRRYHERTKNTILIVSHSMEDIATFADKILVMSKAKLFCYDETVNVFARADEISDIGLDVPQITKVFGELRRRGLDFGKEVYTVGYARDLLLKHLKDREVR
ncbi:MAG: energy-coupling factor transporter ATPase, partial [Ruminococcus sp.]|nr:energy-coupling factor transporter ATPase [Ruminococcus sp.]